MATRNTRSRKRRYKSLDSTSHHSRSPPTKRRRLTTSVLAPHSASSQYHGRQHYLTANLTKLRNDDKISDVTFVLPAKPSTPHTNPASSEHTVDAASLSDDDQTSTTKSFKCIRALFAAVCCLLIPLSSLQWLQSLQFEIGLNPCCLLSVHCDHSE